MAQCPSIADDVPRAIADPERRCLRPHALFVAVFSWAADSSSRANVADGGLRVHAGLRRPFMLDQLRAAAGARFGVAPESLEVRASLVLATTGPVVETFRVDSVASRHGLTLGLGCTDGHADVLVAASEAGSRSMGPGAALTDADIGVASVVLGGETFAVALCVVSADDSLSTKQVWFRDDTKRQLGLRRLRLIPEHADSAVLGRMKVPQTAH
jgi:hypothetical protein